MATSKRRAALFLRAFVALLTLSLASACGGGGGGGGVSTPPPPAKFTIGGTVVGLAPGASVQLANSGGDKLTIGASGSFTFPTSLQSQQAYAASVATQPSGQFCNVNNGTGTVASASVTDISVVCAQLFAGGGGTLPPGGGTVSTEAITVLAPPGALVLSQKVTIASVPPPSGLPAGVTPIGAAVDVSLDKPGGLNAPLVLTMRYDVGAVTDEGSLAVAHFNVDRNAWEPVTILAQDTTAHTITFTARSFSPDVIIQFPVNPPSVYRISRWQTTKNGWDIPNFGSYFSPGGNCLGMAAYSIWYFQAHPAENLFGRYPHGNLSAGNYQAEEILVMRAMLAEGALWDFHLRQNIEYEQTSLGSAKTGRLIKSYISFFGEPLILDLRNFALRQAHASVVYGYDDKGFFFYDVNFPGQDQYLSFNGMSFDPYGNYTWFGFNALSDMGQFSEFQALADSAGANFSTSSVIQVTSPANLSSVPTPIVHITGEISGALANGASLVAYSPLVPPNAYGDHVYVIASPVQASFAADMPIGLGTNTILLFAGANVQNENAFFPNEASMLLQLTGVPPPPLVVTPSPIGLAVGTTATLYANVFSGQSVDATWATSDSSVASVTGVLPDGTGSSATVTGLKDGQVTISATDPVSGALGSATVNVRTVTISAPPSTVLVGDTVNLTASGSGGTPLFVSWVSSDSTVAKVQFPIAPGTNDAAAISAIAPGAATITATEPSSGASNSVTLDVKPIPVIDLTPYVGVWGSTLTSGCPGTTTVTQAFYAKLSILSSNSLFVIYDASNPPGTNGGSYVLTVSGNVGTATIASNPPSVITYTLNAGSIQVTLNEQGVGICQTGTLTKQ